MRQWRVGRRLLTAGVSVAVGVALGLTLLTTAAAQVQITKSGTATLTWPVTATAGGALRTGTTAGNTLLLQAYDNDTGPAYVTMLTLTANNDPTVTVPASVGLSIADGAPAVTTAKLYNVGGVLTWDGAALGAGVGATTALSNLAAVAINATLIPGTAGAVDVGSATKPFGLVYFSGTSGTPATMNFRLTGASTAGTRIITFPDAALDLSVTTANYVLATGSAGAGALSVRALVAADIPTLNQNTTGSAAKWTTARNLAGNSVDGSANVAFANTFIVQGTVDAGLSGAQFLGALATGMVKNTNTTGVLSIGAANADYVAPTGITDMTWATGGTIRTGAVAGNTLLLQAYDNDTGPGYITMLTLTANNDPTIGLPAGIGLVIADGAPGVTTNKLYNNGGVLTFNGAAVGGASALSAITAAVAGNTLANAANAQVWNWDTLTTETAMTLASSSATTGTVLALATTGTAALTGQKVLSIASSGANATGAQSTYGLYATNTKTGTSVNYAGYFAASGGSTNYALYGAGPSMLLPANDETGLTIGSNTVGPTGSNTIPMLNVVTKWNTTGVVDGALRVAVTDTASGLLSLPFAVYGGAAGATSLFKVDKTGLISAPKGIGLQNATTMTAWDVPYPSVIFGMDTFVGFGNDTNLALASNVYYSATGAAWKLATADAAALILLNKGTITLSVAPTGAAYATVTWTNALTIDNGGNISAVGQILAQESFDQPHQISETDWTAVSLADAGMNYVLGSPVGLITYREEQTKTASSWVTTTGVLDISADDTTDNEGVEIYLGDGASAVGSSWVRTGVTGGCFEVNITLTDNAGTDQLFIGWRDASTAFADDGLLATYSEYLGIGINNVDGSIFAQHEIATAATSDDSGVNWGDGETRTLKSCINATTRVPTAFYTAAGGTTYTAVTLTNSGLAQTASVNMNPFISFLNAAGTDAGISINWFRITR